MKTTEQKRELSPHQALLLEMLKDFDAACRKHAIRYQLFAGTALGAVRHKGFIPWDDDLDVILLRSEYDRFFEEAAPELDPERYYVQREGGPHWPMQFSKLRRNNTACMEKYHPKDPCIHQGVYIDIFPCDNLSDAPAMRQLQFAAAKVVIATGASPRELGLPEEKKLRGRGVAYCAVCDGMRYKDKTVVVSGGGNSAAEDALFLAKICKKVYLVHRRDALRASMVYQNALKDSPVEFLWNSRIEEILHEKKVTGVRLADVKTGEEREIACDGVFVAIGRVPDTAVFEGQVERNEQGYIIADETTRTNVPGVFAVGDVRTKPLRQIVTAASDGAVASKFIEEFIQK